MQYEIIIDEVINLEVIKRITEDGQESFIPTDPANSDYQQYLLWLEEQA